MWTGMRMVRSCWLRNGHETYPKVQKSYEYLLQDHRRINEGLGFRLRQTWCVFVDLNKLKLAKQHLRARPRHEGQSSDKADRFDFHMHSFFMKMLR